MAATRSCTRAGWISRLHSACEQRHRLVLLIDLALQLRGMLGDRFRAVLHLEDEDRGAGRRDDGDDLQPADH